MVQIARLSGLVFFLMKVFMKPFVNWLSLRETIFKLMQNSREIVD